MKSSFDLCIVVPAYNEALKLDVKAYCDFLDNNPRSFIVLANDASTDNTLELFSEIRGRLPNQSHILSNNKNSGKAETVRSGMLWAHNQKIAPRYAFLDADLATNFEDCLLVAEKVNEEVLLSFGSRVLTVNSQIERKIYRHYIGRVVATAISKTLKLPIYDTQCGCKVFHENVVPSCFEEKFISRWLFDVEIFFRMIQMFGREAIRQKIHEHPLKRWIDKGKSKIKFSYFIKLWLDLWNIRARYRKL